MLPKVPGDPPKPCVPKFLAVPTARGLPWQTKGCPSKPASLIWEVQFLSGTGAGGHVIEPHSAKFKGIPECYLLSCLSPLFLFTSFSPLL